MADGFHLIELLIVITIIGILSAFGFSSYTHHLVAARRVEAETALQKLAIAIEHYQIEHDSYQGINLAELHTPEFIANNHYQLQIQAVGDANYLITAIPQGAQAERDASCASLTLDEKGERGVTGTGKVDQCW